MIVEDLIKELKECFKKAEKDEKKGIKHKGLLVNKPDDKSAREYIQKAKNTLEWCEIYRVKGADYKIPEEWYYSLYYCALALLSKLGVESRSQRYTALLLNYLQDKNLINYNKSFIDSITVHVKKGQESEVDKREGARYSPSIKIEKVVERYDEMTEFCKQTISQTEEIIFSNEIFEIPRELLN